MKLLKIYSWIAGSKSDFIKSFRDNEALYQQAKNFWTNLDKSSLLLIAIFIVLGIFCAFYYYKPYNNKPGRHYTIRHWVGFLILTFVVTFLVTFGSEYLIAEPKLKGAVGLEIKIAIGNAIYASAIYFITSLVWCNIGTTNAYRFLKF